MPINRWTDKQNVVHMYNGILFSSEKEGKSDAWYKDKPLEYYIEWNKPIKKSMK